MTKNTSGQNNLLTRFADAVKNLTKTQAPQPPQTPAQRGRAKLQRGVDKIRRALPKTADEHIDTVRVGIHRDSDYLQEIATGKQNDGDAEYQMLAMTPKELEECKLHYRNEKLYSANGDVVTTQGRTSKNKKDVQAFVMSKDGDLYIATHKGEFNKSGATFTHASFLGGRPAEMAGMIQINRDGKIITISADSGHYTPEPLDMYRGIKALQQKMPEVFAPKANVILFDPRRVLSIGDFISQMDNPQDYPLHKRLRDERINEYQLQKQKIQALSKKCTLNCKVNTIHEAIARLSDEQLIPLSRAIEKDEPVLFVQDNNNVATQRIIKETLNSGNVPAMRNITKCVMQSNNSTAIKEFVSQVLKHSNPDCKSSVTQTFLLPKHQEQLAKALMDQTDEQQTASLIKEILQHGDKESISATIKTITQNSNKERAQSFMSILGKVAGQNPDLASMAHEAVFGSNKINAEAADIFAQSFTVWHKELALRITTPTDRNGLDSGTSVANTLKRHDAASPSAPIMNKKASHNDLGR